MSQATQENLSPQKSKTKLLCSST